MDNVFLLITNTRLKGDESLQSVLGPVPIPVNCRLLVAERTRPEAYSLAEVFRLQQPLLNVVQHPEWTPSHGLASFGSFYRVRGDLLGQPMLFGIFNVSKR